jgi:rRNA-processing protein FCF1
MTIEQTAKELCNDSDCKRIKIQATKDNKEFKCVASDKEAIECIIKAIETHKKSMPIVIQDTSNILVKWFNEKSKNSKI